MDDLAEVKQRLLRLKALGLRISVDDFGTGYSSLGHLKELPIDKVKIDRSFVHDLPRQPRLRARSRAPSCRWAHSLDITVIAEGVETEAQARFLPALGLRRAAGHLGRRADAAARVRGMGRESAAAQRARMQRRAFRARLETRSRVSTSSSAASSRRASPAARARRSAGRPARPSRSSSRRRSCAPRADRRPARRARSCCRCARRRRSTVRCLFAPS